MSLQYIFYLELESFFISISSIIPTTIGVLLRFLITKALAKKISGMCWIQRNVIIVHADRLKIGKYFAVNSGTYINAIGSIEIGDHVLIGNNVTISSGMHPIDQIEPVISCQSIPSSIIIEDDVWIGAGSVIMPTR